MTAKDIENKILEKYPFIFRNNRGAIKTKKGYITFGIPHPPHGRKEKDTEPKGSDYIGFIDIASIEIKTLKDKIKLGQIKWLRFVMDHGGIAELWQETKEGLVIKRGEDI